MRSIHAFFAAVAVCLGCASAPRSTVAAESLAGTKTYARSTDRYTERDVTVPHGNISLAGTLTLPAGVTRPPLAVLITGSGPQDRNEEVFGFPVFENLAHALAQGGVAVLRLDDRGVGESTGDFRAATTADFATDTEAAVQFARSLPEVDGRRIGLIGHSEGGLVAPMVAVKDPGIAFVVLLAGPGQPMDELLAAQTELIGRAEGLPADQVKRKVEVIRHGLALLKAGEDLGPMEAELEACGPDCTGGPRPSSAREEMETPWFRALAFYDPQPALRRLRCPVLALGGTLDLQVPPALNLPLIRAALSGTRATVEELDGDNHLFQKANTGAVSEYWILPQELDPRVPEKILTFVRGAGASLGTVAGTGSG